MSASRCSFDDPSDVQSPQPLSICRHPLQPAGTTKAGRDPTLEGQDGLLNLSSQGGRSSLGETEVKDLAC